METAGAQYRACAGARVPTERRSKSERTPKLFDFDFDSFTSNPTCGVSAPALRVVCPNEVLRPAPF